MSNLKAEALLREFHYNGDSHSRSRSGTDRGTGPRPTYTQLSGDRHRVGVRPRSHRLSVALHLQPGDRHEGLSRCRSKVTTAADLLALFAAKATAPPPESSQMLVRHFQCKESLKAAHCLPKRWIATPQATAIRCRLRANYCPRWDNHTGAGLHAGAARARHSANNLQPRIPRRVALRPLRGFGARRARRSGRRGGSARRAPWSSPSAPS